MKKILFFILVPLFFLSCHKNKSTPVTCDSYIIGTVTSGGSTTTLPIVTLVTESSNTGQVIKNYKNIIQVVGNGLGVYDHIHSCYYLYGEISTTKAVLYRLNVSTGVGDTLGYPVFDTTDGNYFFNTLVCNSTTGKLYFIGQDNSDYVLYEITPNTTGFSQRQVFVASTSTILPSPVVDENTGFIYFVYSSVSGQDGLMKVDPASGNSSIVVSSFSSAIIPAGLIYNNNDGLFYGFNAYLLAYGFPQYVPFISIDPATGNVNIINGTPSYYFDFTPSAFDFCDNLYMMGGVCIEPSTGNVVKQFNVQSLDGNFGIY